MLFGHNRHCERSEAIQGLGRGLDCFVAALLAMTVWAVAPAAAQTPSVQDLNILDGNHVAQKEHCWAVADGSLVCGFVAVDPATGLPFSGTDLPPLPQGAAQDGTDATGATPPAGAAGIRGWLSGLYLDFGAPGSTACATDSGSCNVNALLQRIAQRLTSLIASNLAVTESQLETDLGAPGAAACATDTASCALNAQMQRLAQRLTSILTALGSPMQATGGTIAPLAVAPTDCGGTITTGGAAQTAAAADSSRKSLLIENPVAATEDLFGSVTGAATTTGAGDYFDLAPGGSATLTLAGTVIQAAVSVNAATTGHRFLCTYTR
jgi:hypothetical protein